MLGYIITIVLAGLQVSRAYADQHNVTYLACLENSDCWLKHDFTYDDNWNSCHGDQYVTKYKGYYVGVILCSSSRYKIFMSESLSDKFLNIADGSGHGQDHCQFVGAVSESQANLPGDFWSSPTVIGYYRYKWGDDIRKGNIGRLPTSTGKYYVKWYECQVEIPGSRVVLTNFNVSDHIPTTAVPSTSPSTNHTATSSPTSPTAAVHSISPSSSHTPTSSPTSPTAAVHSISPSTSRTATSSPTSPTAAVHSISPSTSRTPTSSPTTPTAVSNITRHTSPSLSSSSYETCLNSPNCWLKYAFTFEDNWNSCHGDQYVIKYGEHYVGVVLCSSTRYKLFMSESLSDKFLNIADGSGHGQDHCQFVGAASESQANLPGDFWTSPTTTGFCRSRWGQPVKNCRIGGSPSWTGQYYVKWYECGVTIPGSAQVVDYSDPIHPSLKTTAVPVYDPDTCVTSSDCWLKYSFTYDDNWNSCHGDQYVTKYKHLFVGAVLCSDSRYKLFMSESLSDKFLNIADGGGHGQDHCQFVGAASESQANLPGDFWSSPTTTGYFRYKWADPVQKGRIGGSPSWTGKYYVKWYECGMTIPGSRQVVEYTDKSSPTTSPASTNSTTSIATTAIPRTCTLSTNSPTASATHPRVSGGYSTHSCSLCTTSGQDEVHVINMYQPTGSHRGFRQDPTNIVSVPVEIKSATNMTVNIKLVLITYEAANWVITKPDNVHIQDVTLASYYHTFTTVNLQNNVTKDRTYISGWSKISKLQAYVTGLYGHMNSYTGVYNAPSWVLNVGSC